MSTPYKTQLESAAEAFQKGAVYNGTYTFDKGTRQGELSGYAVELVLNKLQLVEYGPSYRGRGGPAGTKRRILEEKEVAPHE